MKVIILPVIVSIVLIVLFQSFIVMPTNKTEEQKYSLVRKYNDFEITKISMTTPVQMDINDSVSTMSFVMPSEYSKENLPKPKDPGVQIKNTSDEYVAVIRFGGYASDTYLKFYSKKLQNLLKINI